MTQTFSNLIITQEQCARLVEENSPFFSENVRTVNGQKFIVYDYPVNHPDLFPSLDVNDISTYHRREIRGITFSADLGPNGFPVRRTPHKSFNVGQIPDSDLSVVEGKQIKDIMTKEDGSLIAPLYAGGRVYWGTKLLGSSFHHMVNDVFTHRIDAYTKMAMDFIDKGITPYFELCCAQNQIVLSYPHDDLILLGARENWTGRYLTRMELEPYASYYGITLVGVEPHQPISILLEDVRARVGVEGVIVRFENDDFVKIKGDEYCSRHGAVDAVMRENVLAQHILSDEFDDLISRLDGHNRSQADAYASKLLNHIDWVAKSASQLIETAFEIAPDNKRERVKWVNNQTEYPTALRSQALSFMESPEDTRVEKIRARLVKWLGNTRISNPTRWKQGKGEIGFNETYTYGWNEGIDQSNIKTQDEGTNE